MTVGSLQRAFALVGSLQRSTRRRTRFTKYPGQQTPRTGKNAAAMPIAERYAALARKKHGEQKTSLSKLYQAENRYAETKQRNVR
jgi:hypothetical protein